MPSVRALWKIVLCQISSLVKYRQNKTNEASASALSSATSFGTTINSWIKYNLNNTKAELSEMLNNCSILLFVRNDKEIECKKSSSDYFERKQRSDVIKIGYTFVNKESLSYLTLRILSISASSG